MKIWFELGPTVIWYTAVLSLIVLKLFAADTAGAIYLYGAGALYYIALMFIVAFKTARENAGTVLLGGIIWPVMYVIMLGQLSGLVGKDVDTESN